MKRKRVAKTIHVLVTERDRQTLAAIRAVLATDDTIQVVGEATSGSQTLRQIQSHRPDLVLLDMTVPRAIGLDVVAQIRKKFPAVRVVAFSGTPTGPRIRAAVRAGVSGYLIKDGVSQLVGAVRSVVAGETYVSPVATQLMEMSGASSPAQKRTLENLTPRQREVLRLIAEGYSNKQIAPVLGLSVKTVDSHRTRLMRRLRAHDVTGLVRYAINTGLVAPEH